MEVLAGEFDLDDFFSNAPEAKDVSGNDIDLDFDAALSRAVDDKDDQEAFAALTWHIETVQENGDLTRLAEMSMVLGTTACMHDHMQEMANSVDMFGAHNKDSHDHSDSHYNHQHENQEKTKKTCGKCKKNKNSCKC
ncbi:TPA: hypothetical protein EYO12_02240 [Candidatus Saccharibacteria bacterium]|nr:hypothetical protein [Candidatus Saccharibacteria bacterium]HIO87534.1 hypothetical protein [Candidatus Saccharibacteria bacterium]